MAHSQFIRSVCCDAPVKLDYLSHDITDNTVRVFCVRCGESVGGAAVEALPLGTERAIRDAIWDRHSHNFKLGFSVAHTTIHTTDTPIWLHHSS